MWVNPLTAVCCISFKSHVSNCQLIRIITGEHCFLQNRVNHGLFLMLCLNRRQSAMSVWSVDNKTYVFIDNAMIRSWNVEGGSVFRSQRPEMCHVGSNAMLELCRYLQLSRKSRNFTDPSQRSGLTGRDSVQGNST
jgi:hypothetical protein